MRESKEERPLSSFSAPSFSCSFVTCVLHFFHDSLTQEHKGQNEKEPDEEPRKDPVFKLSVRNAPLFP